MEYPDNLKYTKEHEWIRLEEDIATIGITDHAQEQLGDIVYTELPDVGETIHQGDAFAVVESVKAVSDVFAPVTGDIVECNDPLIENPEMLNEDCYGEGWMVKVRITDVEVLGTLMTHDQYAKFVEENIG